jgi:cell division transport system permease protein
LGLISGVQSFIHELLSQQADFIQFVTNGLSLSPEKALILPLALLALGSSVGLLGSLFAVRRFATR